MVKKKAATAKKKNITPQPKEPKTDSPISTLSSETDADSSVLSINDLAVLAEYFSNGMNGTRAWMTVHKSQYNSASASFSEWLRYPKIQAEIKSRLELALMPVEEAMARTAAIARANIRDLLKEGNDGFMYFDLSHPEAEANMHLIAQMETKRERRIVGFGEQAEEFEGEWVKVKLYDSQAALRDILKMHGKFVQKMELTGKDGAPLNPPVDHEGFDRSINTLTDAIREALFGKDTKSDSAVEASK